MKRTLYLLICLSVLAWTMQSCSDDNKAETPSTSDPEISFPAGSETQPVFATEGGTSTLTFTASEAWTASVGEANTRAIDWLTVSPTSGQAGTATLTITTEPNTTYDERNAAIILTSGSTRKTLTVTQKQQDALTVTSNKVELEATGGEFSIELQSNITVSYEIAENAQTWLTPASDTRALTTTTLRFQAATNEDLQPRQGVITLSGGDGLTEEVTVYQAGSGPVLILTQKEYLVGSDGETIQVELKSNNTYQIEMPSVDWITTADTRALSTYTHYFTIAPNDTYDAREAVIRFVDRENGLEDSVKVTQVQRDAIILAKNKYEVSGTGETLNFSIQANVDFTISTNVDWITQTNTRGLVEYPLSFNISPNESDNPRTGIITIADEDNNRQEITVKQAGKVDYEKIEREALIEFYKAANGDDWTDNTNWCSDKPLNEWNGIYTDEDGYVTKIDLLNGPRNVVGDIEEMIAPLSKLSRLSILYLGGNSQIYGEFPEQIYEFSNLTAFQIDNGNRFIHGKLTSDIKKLAKLEYLSLDNLTAEEDILQVLCTMPSLKGIALAGFEIGGTIPEEIGNLEKLEFLNLSENNLEGEIPPSIGRLSNLQQLILDWNTNLSGSLPKEIGNLTNLMDLFISNTGISGEIPEEIGNLTQLRNMYLRGNQISGEIPESIGNLTNLSGLFLDDNYLSGPIPVSICNLRNLIKLNLQALNIGTFGELSGPIPEDIGNLANLEYLNLIQNKLTGSLPESMSKLAKLKECHLRGNCLSGTIPEAVLNSPMWASWSPLDNIIPQQEGYELDYGEIYTSTDYSKDGEVILLQQHTEGNGIPVIFMGDAFVDKDMNEGGYYEETMKQAVEAFFSKEPTKSLRHLFDIYCIKVVSANNLIGGNTALGTYHFSHNGVAGDDSKCLDYVRRSFQDISNARITVIMNDATYGGTCAMYADGPTIAYVTLYDTAEYPFEQTLLHESVGHGFGLLADEYCEYTETVTDDVKNNTIEVQNEYGFYLNIDFTEDPQLVRWNRYISDPRYADENIGVYEGAFASYSKGVYRPSLYSIMNGRSGVDEVFNAPSREIIYRKAMKQAFGENWEFDYESFVAFDLAHQTIVPKATRRGISQAKKTAKPIVHKYPVSEIRKHNGK